MFEYFILSTGIQLLYIPINTLSVTIVNKFEAKDDKFNDLLDGIDIKDLFN